MDNLKDAFLKNPGKEVQKLLIDRAMTKKELGNRLGWSAPRLSRKLRGEDVKLTLEELALIIEAMGGELIIGVQFPKEE